MVKLKGVWCSKCGADNDAVVFSMTVPETIEVSCGICGNVVKYDERCE
jgi:ribosomal protein S27E